MTTTDYFILKAIFKLSGFRTILDIPFLWLTKDERKDDINFVNVLNVLMISLTEMLKANMAATQFSRNIAFHYCAR